jgi:hypothetical protein
MAKSPEVAMEVRVAAWLPEFVIENVLAALVVLRVWFGKVSEAGLKVRVVVGAF